MTCLDTGFGADIGMESESCTSITYDTCFCFLMRNYSYTHYFLTSQEFFNIKCRESGLKPKCAVIVATVRALKMHGGGPPVSAGKPLASEYTEENIPLVTAGCDNLVKHIENAKKFGVEVVVAINQFKFDTAAEMEAVRAASLAAGAFDAVVSNHWAEGGKGAEALGRAVVAACEASNVENFRYLYDLELPIREKVEAISKEIYGADGVDFSELAEQQMAQYESSGFGNLPSESIFCRMCENVSSFPPFFASTAMARSSFTLVEYFFVPFQISLYCENTIFFQLRRKGKRCTNRFPHFCTRDS